MSAFKTGHQKAILETIPFFAGLPCEELSQLEEIVTERKFRKNELILLAEETNNCMYVVITGKVKVVQISLDGREQIVAIHKKGDFFGEMSLLDGKTLPATVIAMRDATVGLIMRHDFERYFLKNDKVLKQIIALLC